MKEAYDFKDLKTGEIVTLEMEYGELLKRMDCLRCIVWKGRELQKLNPHEHSHGHSKAVHTPFSKAYNRPLRSRSLGVHSSQAAEFNERARIRGNTGVYYDPASGDCYFSSRRARKDEAKARGVVDLDGGYGDG